MYHEEVASYCVHEESEVIEVSLSALQDEKMATPALFSAAAAREESIDVVVGDVDMNDNLCVCLDEQSTVDGVCVIDPSSNHGEYIEVDTHGVDLLVNTNLADLLNLGSDLAFMNKLNVLSWALQSGQSESAFEELQKLPNWDRSKILDGYTKEECELPKNLSYLKQIVYDKLGSFLPVKPLEVEYTTKTGKNGTANAAYVSIIDQLRVSLHNKKFLVRALKNTNALPDEWWVPEKLKGIIALEDGKKDVALIWKVSHGTQWYQSLVDHEEYWMPTLDSEKENIVLQLSYYIDDVKIGAINSSVSQTCVMVSVRDHYDGGASFGNNAVFVVMLANAVGTSRAGYDKYWDVFTEDMKTLASGVPMCINGKIYQVYAFDHSDLGDTPAQRCGKSFVKVTNIEKPCRCCGSTLQRLVVQKIGKGKQTDMQFVKAGQNVAFDHATLRGWFEGQNESVVGVPTNEMMKQNLLSTYGLNGFSVRLTWPGKNQVGGTRQLMDVMHLLCLGLTPKFFLIVMHQLGASETAWCDLGDLWSKHCQYNNRTDLHKFRSKETFKTYMKANSLKHFVPFATHALLELNLISVHKPNGNTSKSAEVAKWERAFPFYSFWCLYSLIHEIMVSFVIYREDLTFLEKYIPVLLNFWENYVPEMMTINAHSLEHAVEQIMFAGNLIFHSSFVFEATLGLIKKSMVYNTNFKSLEFAAMKRIVTQRLQSTIEHNTSCNTSPEANVCVVLPPCESPCSANVFSGFKVVIMYLEDAMSGTWLRQQEEVVEYLIQHSKVPAGGKRKPLATYNYVMFRRGEVVITRNPITNDDEYGIVHNFFYIQGRCFFSYWSPTVKKSITKLQFGEQQCVITVNTVDLDTVCDTLFVSPIHLFKEKKDVYKRELVDYCDSTRLQTFAGVVL